MLVGSSQLRAVILALQMGCGASLGRANQSALARLEDGKEDKNGGANVVPTLKENRLGVFILKSERILECRIHKRTDLVELCTSQLRYASVFL